MSQLIICTFSLQHFYVFRCLLRKTLFLTYQLMSSPCLTVPVCPIKFETSLLFARQAGYVSFTIVSSDEYLFFLINYRESQNQCTTLLPAAKWCLATYPGWIPNWSFMVRVLMNFTRSVKDWSFHSYCRLWAIWGRSSNPWTHWESGKSFMSNHKRKIIAMQSPWIHWPYGLCCICTARHCE